MTIDPGKISPILKYLNPEKPDIPGFIDKINELDQNNSNQENEKPSSPPQTGRDSGVVTPEEHDSEALAVSFPESDPSIQTSTSPETPPPPGADPTTPMTSLTEDELHDILDTLAPTAPEKPQVISPSTATDTSSQEPMTPIQTPEEEFPNVVSNSGEINWTSRNSHEKRLIRSNNQLRTTHINSIITEVDAEIAAGTLDSSQRKQALLERLLPHLGVGGQQYANLPDEQQQSLMNFLMQYDIHDLIGAQVQGSGGDATGEGVTGSGTTGHYVNSILSSVDQLLSTNRLTGEVLAQMTAFQSAELHSDLEDQRTDLIRSTLQEIAFPESINQHARGTCAATVVQMMYAIHEPASYLQLMQGLASSSGQVADELIHDGSMSRDSGTLSDDGSGRSISSRLLQPAFMEYANDDNIIRNNYDNAEDEHYLGFIPTGSGLLQGESEHLIQGLFGEENYTGVSGSGDEFVRQIETHIQQGTPISAGLRWRDGGHRILITEIDRQNNQVFYMNPWGELQTMSVDDLERRLKNAVIPTEAPSGNQDAMARLPGTASNRGSYTAIDWYRLRTLSDHLEVDETLSHYLSESQVDQIVDKFDDLDISAGVFDYAIWTIQSGQFNQTFLDRLENIDDKDEAIRFMELSFLVSNQQQAGGLTAEEGQFILSSYPEKHLNEEEFDNFTTAFRSGDWTTMNQLVTTSRQRMVQSAMGQEVTTPAAPPETPTTPDPAPTPPPPPAPPTQSEIRARFNHLEGGWTSDAQYEQLEQLAGIADADTKAYMINQLMDGWTTDRAERAIAIIIGNSGPGDQNAILSALNLRQLGSEMENPDQAAEVLNRLMRGGFDADVMEEHMNSFFDGVSSQSSFFNLFNTDDDTADSFIRKLDDASLQALPDSVKMRFFRALDNGSTSDSEMRRMRELAEHSSASVKAQMIDTLLDHDPTYASEETLVVNIIRDASPNELLGIMRTIDGSRLADELENDDEAVEVGIKIAQAYHQAGRTPIGGELTDYLRRLAYDHRDEAIVSLVNSSEMQANGRELYKAINASTIKVMIEKLMAGDTDENEEDAIMTLLNNTSWEQYSDVVSNSDRSFLNNLINELDMSDIARIIDWSTEANDWSAMRTLLSSVSRQYYTETDSYAVAMIDRLSSNQLNQVPNDILHTLHGWMDSGWTTDGEYSRMHKLERARHW